MKKTTRKRRRTPKPGEPKETEVWMRLMVHDFRYRSEWWESRGKEYLPRLCHELAARGEFATLQIVADIAQHRADHTDGLFQPFTPQEIADADARAVLG